eukprot:6186114-Pleurochrysis_carterae.AAC.1
MQIVARCVSQMRMRAHKQGTQGKRSLLLMCHTGPCGIKTCTTGESDSLNFRVLESGVRRTVLLRTSKSFGMSAFRMNALRRDESSRTSAIRTFSFLVLYLVAIDGWHCDDDDDTDDADVDELLRCVLASQDSAEKAAASQSRRRGERRSGGGGGGGS